MKWQLHLVNLVSFCKHCVHKRGIQRGVRRWRCDCWGTALVPKCIIGSYIFFILNRCHAASFRFWQMLSDCKCWCGCNGMRVMQLGKINRLAWPRSFIRAQPRQNHASETKTLLNSQLAAFLSKVISNLIVVHCCHTYWLVHTCSDQQQIIPGARSNRWHVTSSSRVAMCFRPLHRSAGPPGQGVMHYRPTRLCSSGPSWFYSRSILILTLIHHPYPFPGNWMFRSWQTNLQMVFAEK